MSEKEDPVARFEEARLFLSFAAACVALADLEYLGGVYERASSPQELARGLSLDRSSVAEQWRETIEAAWAFKEKSGPITDEVREAVRQIVLSARSEVESEASHE